MSADPLVTVLYEDSRIGREFPLHHLILRMVEDDINGETWRLLRMVRENPKKGVDKLLADVRATALTAGQGALFVLVDRDQIVHHIRQNAVPGDPPIEHGASDAEIVEAILRTSDAPEKLRVFLLAPNLEGLVAAVDHCAPGRWADLVATARKKDRISRDLLFKEASRAAQVALRMCLRGQQPGLDALASALGQLLPGPDPTP